MKLFAFIACAFLSGAISVLGWAPFCYWPLALAGAAGLYWLIVKCRTALHAAYVGLAYGIGLHAIGQDWIFSSLHSKTGMPAFPAALSTIFLVLYLALFSALPCMIWHALFKPYKYGTSISVNSPLLTISTVLNFAALLSLGEWLRSLLFLNGFTSLSFGYSLIDTWLAGYAPVIGLYGLSAIGFCISGLLANLIQSNRKFRASCLILICAIFGVGFAFHQLTWVHASGPLLSYRLIQPNITQNHKFDSVTAREQAQQLVTLIGQKSADLIVTPETSFEMHLNDLPADVVPRLQQFSRQTRSHLFLGIMTLSDNSDGFNSLIQISPDQSEITQYNKVRLMPFGEYSPSGFRWFSDALNIPFKDLSAGTIDQVPFTAGTQRLGTLICYEDGSGDDVRRWLPDVSVFLNPSNLAWFEDSLAIDQNLQVVRMRALESGRPVLRTANTGVTAHIDYRGNVISRLPEGKEGVLTGSVQPIQGLTPFAYWGDWLAVSGSILYLAFAQLMNTLSQRRRTKKPGLISRPEE